MPANYTVIYTHPSGATATFIYQEGELSALAKGLDAEQFWTFKQVKSLLLRNDEDDLALASQMMADQGFTAQIGRALPDLLAPIPVPAATGNQHLDDAANDMQFRHLPDPSDFPLFRRMGVNQGEIHWREFNPVVTPPAHKAPPLAMPTSSKQPQVAVKPWQGSPMVQSRGEIHWREDQ